MTLLLSSIKSPFKFLDAYTAQDADRFFGRKDEIKRLIELIFSSRLILLYGASGTGKSSLVQCGLTESLSSEDYFPVIIRRRDNFSNSLVSTLTELVQRKEETDPVVLTRLLVNYSLSPVYLIFDQFEELFISGSLEEQQKFFQQLKELFECGISCKLLLVMREEYLGYLYPFEEKLPELFDFRLRVEPMRESALEEVIIGTFGKVEGIELESPTETAVLIIQNTKSKKNVFQLPYLQVYFDRLWRAGVERGKLSDESTILIDSELVKEVGAIEDVLELFLREQKQSLKEGLYDEQKLTVDRLLEAFVTYEGTRRVHTLETLEKEPGLERKGIKLLLNQLESLRILREDEGQYELSHDSLAKVIDQGRSSEQQKINDIIRRLKDAYREFKDKGEDKDLLLPARRVVEVEFYEETLKTELSKTSESPELWQYIETSQQFLIQKKHAEEEEKERKQQAELEIQKNEQLKKYIVIVGTLLTLAIVALSVAVYQWKQAQQSTDTANALYWASESDKLLPAQAIRLLEKAAGYNLDAETVYERLFRRFNESNLQLFNKVDFFHQGSVSSAVFSPDGTRLLTVSSDTAKLWDTQGKLLATLAHVNTVLSAVFSPDGTRLLTASASGSAELWDTQGKVLATLFHKGAVNSAVFSSDGRRILTASVDGTAKLWNEKGKLQITLFHQDAVNSAVFSPDGTRLLTASDKTTMLWNTQGKLLVTLAHVNTVSSATFSPDGTRLLTASYDKTARLWDTQGRLLATFAHQGEVLSAVFSPDGTQLLTASYDKTARLWDTQGKLQVTLFHQDAVNSAVFSPDGTQLLTASADGTAKLWDTQGKLPATLAHNNKVNSAVFSPDGRHILTASIDKTAKLWDTQGKLPATLAHQDAVNSAVFSPDGRYILTASIDKTAKLWDTQGNLLVNLTHQGPVNSAVFSPKLADLANDVDDFNYNDVNDIYDVGIRQLLTASIDKTAKLWDEKGDPVATLTHKGSVNSAVFSPDGRHILTASIDRTAKLWDEKGNLVGILTHKGPVNSAVFSPDGRHILTASNKTTMLWDTQGRLLATRNHQGQVNSAVFSPDGRYILTASIDKTAKLWDIQSRLVVTLNHQGQVSSAVFSPDGKHILTASADGTAKLWHIHGKLLVTLNHENTVSSATFSPDGRYILTASYDKTARLWNTQGRLLATLNHQERVYSAVFSPDGTRRLTASADGTSKLWFTVEEILKWLKENNDKIAPLSKENKMKYGIEE